LSRHPRNKPDYPVSALDAAALAQFNGGMAAIDDKIAQLEDILDTGAESISVDGMTTRISLDQVRQRLRDLIRQRDRRSQAPKVRLDGGFETY
jgi:hypothetical protein